MSVKDQSIEELEHVEKIETVGLPKDGHDHDEEFSHSEQRKIIHKVDRRLITSLGLLFGVSLMDRTNLGNASIAGMQKDLGLAVDFRYSIILLVFFAPYVLFQLPSSIIVRKLGPRTFLPSITFLWGVVMMSFAFVYDWKVMIATRMILGVLEAGLFPGAIYLLSSWYSRYDVHKRYSSFYLISSVGSASSGILAYGFMQMGGLARLAPWRWIFIMEGILTCVIALIGYAMLVSFPQQAHKSWRFLTERESAYIIRRLNRDRKDADEEVFSWAKFLKPALDLKIWGFAFIFCCATIVAYAISFFLPLILSTELGFSVGISQVLTTPPYIFGGILMYVEGWLGDKYHIRGPIIAYNAIQTIVGLCLLAWTSVPGVQYFGVFLVASGTNSTIPAILAWQANCIRGTWKRAFCSASLISFGGMGGIIGALVFRSQDAPQYLPGIIAAIVCNVLILVTVSILCTYFHISNKRAARGRMVIEDLPGFRYTL